MQEVKLPTATLSTENRTCSLRKSSRSIRILIQVFLAFPVLMVLAGACKQTGNSEGQNLDGWAQVPSILDSISDPLIPDVNFILIDFGAIGDGVYDNKASFDSVIAEASSAGGGKIIVPPGTYLVKGPIHLKSNINLHLEKGSKIVFSSDPDHYLPVVFTSWEGTRLYNYSPFIYAYQQKNLAITGEGEIDGEASETFSPWKKIQNPDKLLSRKMNNENIPLEERVFGKGHYLRPHLIQFYECKNILVEDIKITDSPFWCLHLLYCRNVQLRGLVYDAQNPNNDGIDPESSEYVLIENIDFNNMDDNIAVKSGRDLEARTINRASRNIVIRNCRFMGLNAFAVGSEMSGGVNNIYLEDCSFAGRVVHGIYLKGNRDRGGCVEDIFVRNVEFDSCLSLIMIDSDYKNEGSCCPPKFRNIYIENVSSNFASDHGISLRGFESSHLENINIRNVDILQADIPVYFEHVDMLTMENVLINGKDFSTGDEVSGNSEMVGGAAEWVKFKSRETGRQVWQITTESTGSIACYFEGQAFTSDDRYLVFSSIREGKWRLFRADLGNGNILALTPQEREINRDDYTIHPDGKQACYMDGNFLYGINVSTLEEKVLFDFTDRFTGMANFRGSFTADGKYTLVTVRNEPVHQLYRVNLNSGEVLLVHEQDTGTFSHPLINPTDPEIISYVPGPDTQNDMNLPMEKRARTWKINLRDGTDKPFLICPYGFRATHESWSADGSRFFFYRKTVPGWMPVTICSISKQGDDLREYYTSDTIRLGHGISSQDGKWFISDSQDPGRNPMTLLSLETRVGTILNWPDASTGDGQSTHVHPFFSRSGKFVCYTSDVSGVPQVYVLPVADLTSQVMEPK